MLYSGGFRRGNHVAWRSLFLLSNLISKDFKIRYRNMSLGVLWSLLNPLVMMGVLTFVFTKILVNPMPHFALFVMCGLVPFNFFTRGLAFRNDFAGRQCGSDQARSRSARNHSVGRSALQLSAPVHSDRSFNCAGVSVRDDSQPSLDLAAGDLGPGSSLRVRPVSDHAALNVYVRDMRYFVESANTLLFWLVPVVYSFAIIPAAYKDIYQLNPVAALVMAMRDIFLTGFTPAQCVDDAS